LKPYENFLTDDHASWRQAKAHFADHFKKAVFGQARNATEALMRLTKENWDVMVLDITMPGRSGLDILQDVKRLRPRLPVLVLSMHPEDQFAVRMLKAGAAGLPDQGKRGRGTRRRDQKSGRWRTLHQRVAR